MQIYTGIISKISKDGIELSLGDYVPAVPK